jgi:hypothetical protein
MVVWFQGLTGHLDGTGLNVDNWIVFGAIVNSLLGICQTHWL